ncbi:Kiwa anti-phage protein KwaB-like domain-containing protein [Halanaerobacter jeridensis]|uniref:DUF4868 domain-containing protein n=1 Tax=Halanaerobacter jeridensis TaxID=706427 RepID=A0A938XSS5_9FIRM|nr:hypothetical protein [Halanaerobacter jeridensis]
MESKLQKVKEMLNKDFAASLILVSEYEKEFKFRKVSLEGDLADEFKSKLSNKILSVVDDIHKGKKELVKYNPARKKGKHEIECLDVKNRRIKSVIDNIPETTGIKSFTEGEEEFINSLHFYILVFEIKGEKITIFRKCNKKLKVNNCGIISWFSKGVYNKFEESLFLFDNKFDCFLFEGKIFIRSTYYFHLIFRYYEELKSNADNILDTLDQKVPVSNMDELREACKGHLTMLAKVNNIASSDYFNDIDMENIKFAIKECNVDVDVVEENGREKLVFDSANRWEILKLLADDYLGSVMTDLKYEVNSKKAVNN